MWQQIKLTSIRTIIGSGEPVKVRIAPSETSDFSYCPCLGLKVLKELDRRPGEDYGESLANKLANQQVNGTIIACLF